MADPTVRAAAPAAMALFAVLGLVLSGQPLEVALIGTGVTLASSVLAGARGSDGWELAGILAVASGGVVVVCNANSANVGWFGLCVAMGWCAFRAATAPTLALGLVMLVAFASQVAQVSDEPGWWAWVAGTLFTGVTCAFGRRQRELLDQLREAQAGLADRARAEERNRIAGEMHDVIGHALTVSLLHVSSARLAIEEDPDEARASLAEAERLARRSLEEVRATVGMMRSGSTDAAPRPGAADLGELVESFRRAGTSVDCQVEGDPTTLPGTAGLATYRIVQEALTNVARHAPGSAASVRLSVGHDETQLVVDSDGAPSRSTPEGAGVPGMRERAEAVGGRLTAGPREGGWRVEAVLPR